MQYKDLLFHSSGCYGQSNGHLQFSFMHDRWKSFQGEKKKKKRKDYGIENVIDIIQTGQFLPITTFLKARRFSLCYLFTDN